VLNVYYQQLLDKIYKSQPTLIPNPFEGTVFNYNSITIFSNTYVCIGNIPRRIALL
jgi:hypothetical protein